MNLRNTHGVDAGIAARNMKHEATSHWQLPGVFCGSSPYLRSACNVFTPAFDKNTLKHVS